MRLVLWGCVAWLVLGAPARSRAEDAEEKALKVVERRGGSVRREGNMSKGAVIEVNLHGSSIPDDDLKELVAFKKLVVLDLYRCTKVTDAGVKDFGALKDLQVIVLAHTQVTDASVKRLATCKSLTRLDLRSTKVTDAGMKAVAAHKGLTQLFLSETAISDAGLKDLVPLDKLHLLAIGSTKVTDEGVKGLAAKTSLRVLAVYNTKITDAGVKSLAALENLNDLTLTQTVVTDAGLRALMPLKNLTKLSVINTNVTARQWQISGLPYRTVLCSRHRGGPCPPPRNRHSPRIIDNVPPLGSTPLVLAAGARACRHSGFASLMRHKA